MPSVRDDPEVREWYRTDIVGPLRPLYSSRVATLDSTPQAAGAAMESSEVIELQAALPAGMLPVLLRYSAIAELRTLIPAGKSEATGALFGTRSPTRIVIERCVE